jgi:hypothetical protein
MHAHRRRPFSLRQVPRQLPLSRLANDGRRRLLSGTRPVLPDASAGMKGGGSRSWMAERPSVSI